MTDKEIIDKYHKLGCEAERLRDCYDFQGAENIEDERFNLERKHPHLFEDLPF